MMLTRFALGPVFCCFVATLLASTLLVAPAAADELVLVEEGQSLAPIVIFADAPPLTREAAEELATYIEKTSGARPELIEGEPSEVPEHAIWVGYQPVLDSLFPEQDFNFEHPEEILIAANENHLVIAGRDVWNKDRPTTAPDRRGNAVEGVQQEYGTVNAVYTFLQDYLGVRWLWPGELGIDIIERETIVFEPFEHRYHPQFRERSGILRFSEILYGGGHGHSHDWVRHQRMQLDSFDASAGHAFNGWWDRFHEDHPDYFALQPNGKRSGFPGADRAKLCQSNPAVWDQWLADVEHQLEENPNRVVFSAAPNDSWLSGHCTCENCSAWDHPDGEMRSFRWDGSGGKHVALSDRHVTFANKLARMLKDRYPDKDYYVLMQAYGHSRPKPIEARPDDNVLMSSVANFMFRPALADRGSPNGTLHREQFQSWGEVSKQVTWRPNTGGSAGWRIGFPSVTLRQTMKDFQFIADNSGAGVMIDTVWEHWATQGPMYYLMGQLAWNPYDDGEAVLKDYYQRGFGPAAEDMEAYWTLQERARGRGVSPTGEMRQPLAELYNEAFFRRAFGHLDAAAEKAADGPEKYAQRVAYVRAGLEATELMMESIVLNQQVKESEGDHTEAHETMRANYERVRAIAEAHPHSLRWTVLRSRLPGQPE